LCAGGKGVPPAAGFDILQGASTVPSTAWQRRRGEGRWFSGVLPSDLAVAICRVCDIEKAVENASVVKATIPEGLRQEELSQTRRNREGARFLHSYCTERHTNSPLARPDKGRTQLERMQSLAPQSAISGELP
jgi:hypothetical protein